MEIKLDKEKAIRLYNTIAEFKGYDDITNLAKDEIEFLKNYFILLNKAKTTDKESGHNEILKQHIKLIIDYDNNFKNIKIKFILKHCKDSYNLDEKVFIELCDETYKNKFKY